MIAEIVLGLIFLSILCYGIVWLRKKIRELRVGLSYKVKYLASHRFLSDLDESLVETVVDMPPLNLLKSRVYPKKQEVKTFLSAGGIPILKQSAVYYERGLNKGCRYKRDTWALNAPPAQPKVEDDSNERPWPYGDLLLDQNLEAVDKPKLDHIIEEVLRVNPEIYAILIDHNDTLVAENYNTGVRNTSRILGWSMTKTIGNALIGILQKQGKLHISDLAGISQWSDPKDERRKITINDLLQMQSGLKWVEDYGALSEVTEMLYIHRDCYKYAVNCPYDPNPKTKWTYASGSSNILSGIIRQKFERYEDYLNFPYECLFKPIGMKNALIELDDAGHFALSSYGWATAREWTRFGLLYLKNGVWDGKALFEPDWVDYTRSQASHSQSRYGAHVWLNARDDIRKKEFPSLPDDAFYEQGFGGQMIMIIPSLDMVITVLCGKMKDENFDKFFDNFYTDVLSCFTFK